MDFSPYQLDFLSYPYSKIDILEGPSGTGKSAIGFFKFMRKVSVSKYQYHIVACKNIQKTEQNLLNNENTGLNMFGGLAVYYPRGKGKTTTSHILMTIPDPDDPYNPKKKKEKIIYMITYSDAGKWEELRGGWYGCLMIDECNLVPSEDPEEIPRFVLEGTQRAKEYCLFTLNPDSPDKPIYRLINRARPIPEYAEKGPKEIRNMLVEKENPRYKWWFFERGDNPVMTKEIEQDLFDTYEGTKQFYSMYEGLRLKTERLAFPAFGTKHQLTTDEILDRINNAANENHFDIKCCVCGLDTSFSSKTDDLIACMFVIIGSDNCLYVVDEYTFNNRSVKRLEDKMTASELAPEIFNFMSKNSKIWGYPKYLFVDEADTNTILELSKYKAKNRIPFNVFQSQKRLWGIPDRLRKIDGLICKHRYFVNKDNCREHIRELDIIELDPKDDSKILDKDNHTYDALCYAIEAEVLKGGI